MELACPSCNATVVRSATGLCPVCGDPLPMEPEVAPEAVEPRTTPCPHCGALSEAVDECPVCGASKNPISSTEATEPIPDAPVNGVVVAVEAGVVESVEVEPSVPEHVIEEAAAPAEAESPTAEPEAEPESERQPEPEPEPQQEAQAEPEPAPPDTPKPQTTRLRCSKCGAFVDPEASPDCPVCFEPTATATEVPWTAPADAPLEKESAPLEVSATNVPKEVVDAARIAGRKERLCAWCGARVTVTPTGLCPVCGEALPAEPERAPELVVPEDVPQEDVLSAPAGDLDRPSGSFRRETPLRLDRPSGSMKVVVPPQNKKEETTGELVRPVPRPVVPAPVDPDFQTPSQVPVGWVIAIVASSLISFVLGMAAMAVIRR